MTTDNDQRILDAARRWRFAHHHGSTADTLRAQCELDEAIDDAQRAEAETQPPAHAFKAGDWVAYCGYGHQVRRIDGDLVDLQGPGPIPASDCLPIPPRPEPRDGWEPDGTITAGPCAEWFGVSGQVGHIMEDGIASHPLYGPHRWRAVRAKAEVVEDRHTITTALSPLFDHMSRAHGLTLTDSEMDEIVRVVESLKAAPVPEAPKPATSVFADRWNYIKADPQGARSLLLLLAHGKGTADDFDTMVDRIIESRSVGVREGGAA